MLDALTQMDLAVTLNIARIFQRDTEDNADAYAAGSAFEVRYAAAAVLIACAQSDFVEAPEEFALVVSRLSETFELDPVVVDELVRYASDEAGKRSLKTFTNLINQYFTEDDKRLLIEDLWRVAFADGRLEKYEELFIGRVAFLIDVPPSQVALGRQAVEKR